MLIRGTRNRNQFTLLEVLAIQFEFLGRSGFEQRVICRPNQMNNALVYPDFANIRIRKPAADLKTWEEKPVDMSALFESGDCSVDVPVTWGEVIQLPELDHSALRILGRLLAQTVGEPEKVSLTLDPNLGQRGNQIARRLHQISN